MTENSSATAFAPATVANLGVGFDILGLAVNGLGDTVHVERQSAAGVTIVDIVGDNGKLPHDPQKNTAAVAAAATLRLLGADFGVRLTLEKGLPLASGLGSSAASAVAAAVAVNALAGELLPRHELLPACLEAEAVVSGYHADNVGPSLLGGITLITGTSAGDIRRLPIPASLHFALITPDIAVPTAEARAVLPQSVSLHDMVHQTGAVARVIDALYRGDIHTLAAAMEADVVVEPARAHLIPHLDALRFAAKRAGALGLVISGAGPTLAAICIDQTIAKRVADAVCAVYESAGITCATHVSSVDETGAKVINVVE